MVLVNIFMYTYIRYCSANVRIPSEVIEPVHHCPNKTVYMSCGLHHSFVVCADTPQELLKPSVC